MNPRSKHSRSALRRLLISRLIGIALGLSLWLIAGCGEAGHSQKDAPKAKAGTGPAAYPYRITTTVGMITDIVATVAGDKATVDGIMKGDSDPHTHKPTRSDRIALQEGDVIFYNGLMLEGKMSDVFVKLASEGKPVYAVTQLLDEDKYVMADAADHHDPHVWMDVRGWVFAVKAVAKSLSAYDPANAAYYDANAQAYLAKLEQLDAYARQVIASIPREKRVLITSHDAFNYMARAYDMKVKAPQGISTESEASLKVITSLVDYMVENKIGAVFVEASVSEKNMKALVEGAAARGHKVTIGGKLFSDSMGPAGTYEGTYIGMIDHNVSTIARALGGTVPEGGFKAMMK
jgi:manganese/zinc/iron transport system substrate-binding protein